MMDGGAHSDQRMAAQQLSFAAAGEVRDVQFCPHAPSLFAAALENGMVQIFDIRSAKVRLLQLQAHSGPAYCVEWHPTEPGFLATGGRDRAIKTWEVDAALGLGGGGGGGGGLGGGGGSGSLSGDKLRGPAGGSGGLGGSSLGASATSLHPSASRDSLPSSGGGGSHTYARSRTLTIHGHATAMSHEPRVLLASQQGV